MEVQMTKSISLPFIEPHAAKTGPRWDRHFLRLCLENAAMSKDPSTQVGSVIIGPDREVRSAGFNGFPRGIADTAQRLQDRETKLKLIVHGEMNAILNAARVGIPLKGCTLYLIATDYTGATWGGPPCTRCAVEIIQAGITEIVSQPFKSIPSRWLDDIEFARGILAEAGIRYREVTHER
jgi:dCMP deaminase